MKHAVVCVLLLAASLLCAQSAAPADNDDLTKLYRADQSERQGTNIDWSALYHRDIERRAQLRQMLANGKVVTGADYYHAAMILQHGENPDDYLLAHVLAVDALSKGNLDARWLAAATLDRYLRSIGQPQIYGTQYKMTADKTWVHETMNENMLSDPVRSAACVVSLAQQNQNLAAASEKSAPGGTGIKNCPR